MCSLFFCLTMGRSLQGAASGRQSNYIASNRRSFAKSTSSQSECGARPVSLELINCATVNLPIFIWNELVSVWHTASRPVSLSCQSPGAPPKASKVGERSNSHSVRSSIIYLFGPDSSPLMMGGDLRTSCRNDQASRRQSQHSAAAARTHPSSKRFRVIPSLCTPGARTCV